MVDVKPWSNIATFANKRNIGRKEVLLFLFSSVATLIVIDVALYLVLPPVYQWTKSRWGMAANVEYQKTVQDSPGDYRAVTNRYLDHGFKRWGRLENDHKRTYTCARHAKSAPKAGVASRYDSYFTKRPSAPEDLRFGQFDTFLSLPT